MSQVAVDDMRPQLPRWIAAIIIGAIALASLAALLFPSLPVVNLFTGPTQVNVIRRVIDDPNAAPRIGGTGRREMPAMQRVARQTDAVFLAVDLLEDGAKVRSFMDSLALDRLAPLLDLDGNVTRRYAVLELPQTFFIDPQGVIRHIEHGEVLDDAAVRNGIDKAR
ncbi:MAG: TlpA family protein disulfide reductase [Chloroflexi bacterium]|nr:MAG: TlpA family protein disulfide reductase [Chloroflexota bacterium]